MTEIPAAYMDLLQEKKAIANLATIVDAIYVPAGGPAPGGSRSNTLYAFRL